MKKVKFVLGYSSLALSLFATGCGGKLCGDFTEKAECNKATDKDNQQCLWEEAEGSAKGTCKVKSVLTAGSSLKAELETLKANMENPTFVKGCMAKNKIKLNEVCIFPDNSQDKKSDCEAIAFGKTGLCKYKPAGKCSLLPITATFGLSSIYDNIDWKTGTTYKNLGGLQLQDKNGMPISPFANNEPTKVTDAFKDKDPCSKFTKRKGCLDARLKLTGTVAGVPLLYNTTSKTVDNVPNLCGWDGGEDDDQCMFDADAFESIDCEAIKDQTTCEKEKTFCKWGDTAALATPPAPEGGSADGNGAGNTGGTGK